jgi:hypothetical protein
VDNDLIKEPGLQALAAEAGGEDPRILVSGGGLCGRDGCLDPV